MPKVHLWQARRAPPRCGFSQARVSSGLAVPSSLGTLRSCPLIGNLIGYAHERRRRLATGKPLFRRCAVAALGLPALAGAMPGAGFALCAPVARGGGSSPPLAAAPISVKAKASAVPAALTPWLSRCARDERRAPSAAALRRQTASGAWRLVFPWLLHFVSAAAAQAPPKRERAHEVFHKRKR